jgi:hypothetical protein
LRTPIEPHEGRTLKQEVAQPPAANRRKQQRALDRFRQEYNEVRPHEALGMRTPAEVYEPSARKFPERLPEPEYPAPMLVRSLRRQGHFRWKKDEVFLSDVLWGERVGLLPETIDGSRSTSRSIPLPYSTASNSGWRLCSQTLNSPNGTRKCQICARSKLSGIPPAAQLAV